MTGLMLVTRPLITAEALTLVMAIFFLIGGLFELIGSLVSTSQAGVGGGGRDHHDYPWRAGSCAMARLGTLGDRPFHRDRSDFLWARLDRTGGRVAFRVRLARFADDGGST